MKAAFRALLLALPLAGACASAPASPPTPLPAPAPASAAVPGDPGALEHVVDLAAAREWTVRLVTLRADTLLGRVSHPAPGRLRIRLRDIAFQEVVSVERRDEGSGGEYETRLLAGAAVGAMAGLVLGYVNAVRGDLETGSVRPWMLGGAVAGLVLAGSRGQDQHAPPPGWTPLWRRR